MVAPIKRQDYCRCQNWFSRVFWEPISHADETRSHARILYGSYCCSYCVYRSNGTSPCSYPPNSLSLFWLVTYEYWLDSGSVSAQVLISKHMGDTNTATSLTKYMLKYGLLQGVAFSAVVAGIGTFVPGVFTSDATIQSLLFQCLPHLAFQQTLVSAVLAIGGNQFRYMAAGTTVATAAGVYKMLHANSVIAIWPTAVNTFFGARFLNGLIGVARVHLGLRRQHANAETAAVIA
jgi:hypothetical protein